MYPRVRAAWRPWNKPFEGVIYWMYLDTHNPPLVTTGMGNMIDPVSLALGLPWTIGDSGIYATQEQIEAEWRTVRADTALSRAGAIAARRVTKLRLSDAAIDVLIGQRLDANEAELKTHPSFAALDDWPADAQLGIFSMAWAMGPDFSGTALHQKWPSFSAACAKQDWIAASRDDQMKGSPDPVKRNAATSMAFLYAAQSVLTHADPSVLLSPIPK